MRPIVPGFFRRLFLLLLAPLLLTCGKDAPAPSPEPAAAPAPQPQRKTSPQQGGPAGCPNPVLLEKEGAEAIDLGFLAEGGSRLVTQKLDVYVLESGAGREQAFHASLTPAADEKSAALSFPCFAIGEGQLLNADHLQPPPFELGTADGVAMREFTLQLQVGKSLQAGKAEIVSTGESPEERQEKAALRERELRERGVTQKTMAYKLSEGLFEIRVFEEEKLEGGRVRQSSVGYRMLLKP